MNFTYKNGSFSFVNNEGAGWKGLLFELNGQLSSQLQCSKDETKDTGGEVVLQDDKHNEILCFEVDKKLQALTVSRTIINTGTESIIFKSVSDGLLNESASISLGMRLKPIDYFKIRYFHGSNVKTEKFPRFRVEYPYVRCIPYDAVHFNHDEANHFPAFGICDMDYKSVLVEGDLNQVKFERSWELGLDGANDKSVPAHYKGIQRYTLNRGFTLVPGKSVEVSRVFYQIKEKSHPQSAFADYVKELKRYHEYRGSKTRMLHEGVYCTWNYGTFGNITEELILKRAKVLADNVPNCTHFLIDDGFQALRETYDNNNAGIDSFYPVPSEGYDKEKFPNGMKVVADGIRELGLKPCIWLAPKVYLASPLAKEKPEWLLKNKDGSEKLIGESSFLDLSHPQARDFYLKVLDALFIDWGFEGIKYDFMTQWFLMESSRFGHGSGLEWRDFAFSEIRKRIGDEGFFMTCIAFSAGNPFPGINADSYRCGFDIHDGTWAEQIRACEGTFPQILLKGKDSYLLNMDSAGFSDIPLNEQLFRFTWCFITQGIIEIGGKLEEHSQEQFDIFNKLLKNADRGNKVVCLDEKAFTGEPLPEILQVKYPEDSRMSKAGIKQHLAFFNWSNETKLISVTIKKAGISKQDILMNFWNNETIKTNDNFIIIELPEHSSVLYEVHKQSK